MMRRVRRLVLASFAVAATGLACARDTREASDSATGASADETLIVFNAGSLHLPLRRALDTLVAREHFVLAQEPAGSLETARKLTELDRIPDIVALADYEVFPNLLMPQQVTWYVRFARNRIVLAYTDRSRGARDIGAENWWEVITRPGVEVGRSDPNLDPAGYRTLLVWQLAERHYRQAGLAALLERNAGVRNVRPKEADLVGLLQAGQLDYAWEYESIARQHDLRYVRLPDAIDLGSPADSAIYATAMVRVTGRTRADTLEVRGQPIVYALSIPKAAPHPALAARVVRWLLSDEGRRVLRGHRLDVLDTPVVVGTGAPAALTDSLARR